MTMTIRDAIEQTIADLHRTYPLPSNVSDDHEMAVFDQAVCLADYVLHDVLDALDDARGHYSDLSLDVHDEIVEYLTFG